MFAIVVLLGGVALLWMLFKNPDKEMKQTSDSIQKEQTQNESNQSMSSLINSNNQQRKPVIGELESTTDGHQENIKSQQSNLVSDEKNKVQFDAAIDSFNLPEKLLKPAAETKISRVPRARLTTDNLEMLDFINSRRIQNSLDILDTLPTRLNTEEVLQLTNAKRVSDGMEPLSEMPTGMPEVDENK